MRPRKATGAGAHKRARDPRADLLGGEIGATATSSHASTQAAVSADRARILGPYARGYLSVADGTTGVGTIVPRDGSWLAYDATGELLGQFASQRDAMRSLPRVAS